MGRGVACCGFSKRTGRLGRAKIYLVRKVAVRAGQVSPMVIPRRICPLDRGRRETGSTGRAISAGSSCTVADGARGRSPRRSARMLWSVRRPEETGTRSGQLARIFRGRRAGFHPEPHGGQPMVGRSGRRAGAVWVTGARTRQCACHRWIRAGPVDGRPVQAGPHARTNGHDHPSAGRAANPGGRRGCRTGRRIRGTCLGGAVTAFRTAAGRDLDP